MKNNCSSYCEAFNSSKQYFAEEEIEHQEKIDEIRRGLENIEQVIEKELQKNTENEEDDYEIGFDPIEVEIATKEMKDLEKKNTMNIISKK